MRARFPRRCYQHPAQLLDDVRWLARRRAHSSGAISPPFRERLMLVVTADRCADLDDLIADRAPPPLGPADRGGDELRYRRVPKVSQKTFSLNVPWNGDLPWIFSTTARITSRLGAYAWITVLTIGTSMR